MASTYSTNLGFELPGTGDQAGTWSITNNTNIGTLIEQAISGYATQAITDGADTVITIPNGASGVARNMTLELTGALTAARNLVVPSNRKLYFVFNNTSGDYAVTVKVSGQTGVSVPNGQKMVLVCNGTDVVTAVTYAASLSVGNLSYTGTLTGGTGIVNLGSGQFYKDASGNVGIGTASPGYRLDVQHTTNGIGMRLRNTSTFVELATRTDATTSGIDAGNAPNGMTFSLNTVEGMRLTSTGLGIGTASPLSRLNVAGTTAVTWSGPGDSSALVTIGTQGTAGGSLFVNTASLNSSFASGLAIDGTYSSFSSVVNIKALGVNSGGGYGSSLAFHTSSNTTLTERMRLDTSGNLGIGTATPRGDLDLGTSATSSTTKAVHLGYSVADFYGFRVANTNAAISTFAGTFAIQRGTGSAWVDNVTVDDNANVTAGGGTLATSATNGFLYVPTCAGTPTGTPTAKTGYAPIVVNTTNNKLFFYSGGVWRDAGP